MRIVTVALVLLTILFSSNALAVFIVSEFNSDPSRYNIKDIPADQVSLALPAIEKTNRVNELNAEQINSAFETIMSRDLLDKLTLEQRNEISVSNMLKYKNELGDLSQYNKDNVVEMIKSVLKVAKDIVVPDSHQGLVFRNNILYNGNAFLNPSQLREDLVSVDVLSSGGFKLNFENKGILFNQGSLIFPDEKVIEYSLNGKKVSFLTGSIEKDVNINVKGDELEIRGKSRFSHNGKIHKVNDEGYIKITNDEIVASGAVTKDKDTLTSGTYIISATKGTTTLSGESKVIKNQGETASEVKNKDKNEYYKVSPMSAGKSILDTINAELKRTNQKPLTSEQYKRLVLPLNAKNAPDSVKSDLLKGKNTVRASQYMVTLIKEEGIIVPSLERDANYDDAKSVVVSNDLAKTKGAIVSELSLDEENLGLKERKTVVSEKKGSQESKTAVASSSKTLSKVKAPKADVSIFDSKNIPALSKDFDPLKKFPKVEGDHCAKAIRYYWTNNFGLKSDEVIWANARNWYRTLTIKSDVSEKFVVLWDSSKPSYEAPLAASPENIPKGAAVLFGKTEKPGEVSHVAAGTGNGREIVHQFGNKNYQGEWDDINKGVRYNNRPGVPKMIVLPRKLYELYLKEQLKSSVAQG